MMCDISLHIYAAMLYRCPDAASGSYPLAMTLEKAAETYIVLSCPIHATCTGTLVVEGGSVLNDGTAQP